jgi:hypothetical protein
MTDAAVSIGNRIAPSAFTGENDLRQVSQRNRCVPALVNPIFRQIELQTGHSMIFAFSCGESVVECSCYRCILAIRRIELDPASPPSESGFFV